MNLVITLATRGRPEQLVDTIRRSVANWTDPNTVLVVQIDHDDPASADAVAKAAIHERVILNIQQREDTIADKWNRAMIIPADVYLVAADDDPYMTPGYDTLTMEAAKRFPDGIGMVYGAMANLSFSGSVAPTRKLCELMGYIQPPLFPYWWVDHWTDDIARMIGRISVSNVQTDQSRAGKTQEMREPAWWATFFDACYLVRRRLARSIIDSPDFAGEDWHKDLLRTHHPLIEQRSRGVNQNVRADAQRLEGWSGLRAQDDRYQRVKARALAMLPAILDDPEMPPQDVAWLRNILTPPTTMPGLKQAFA